MIEDDAVPIDDASGIAAAAREWFEANWDPDLTLGEWWDRLAESGYGFPTWPADRYGLGLDRRDLPLVNAARRAVGALGPPAGIAPSLAGPTLLAHGTAEQQDRFLPGIVHGEVWCQLFSEPGSGSDLASLQTRAVRDGDQWIVNGQKVWTSGAHVARYGILIARTDPSLPKHRGLTYFVIDMDQQGIEVRPIREITGRAIFNEVFLTDAVVPVGNTIDAVGAGWGVALTTLANERTMLGAGSFGSSGSSMSITKPDLGARVGDLVRDADSMTATPSGGVGALLRALVEQYGRGDDPLIRQEYATIHSLLEIARYTDLRSKAAVERSGRPGPEVSVGKLAASHLLRTLRETMYRVCGADATLWGDDAPLGGRMHDIGLSSYLISIGGGTDQIQRNIIGERVLGLPGEPRVDKDVAFQDLLVGTQRPLSG
ncbi:MAG: acyl-CoA dehydrogenase family protein [Actinomycetota bacterium]|nr:acyl-CoA dehydrogenase family protein [Actinomycetota bacterium]